MHKNTAGGVEAKQKMGLETRAKKTVQRERIQRYLLSAVAVGGTLALAAAAPNVAGMFAKRIASLPQLRVRTKNAATRLARKGLVRFARKGGNTVLEITEAGRRTLALELAKQATRTKCRWDGKYRIVAFDVPQRYKTRRDTLRRTVRTLGFLCLQRSLWVYPYDCEELVTLIKSELRLGRHVVYMIVDEIENDAWVRKHFKLPAR